MKTARLVIHGRVQGVGYRHFVVGAARCLGLDGWVRNRRDGTVEVLARGEAGAIAALIAECRQGPPASLVAAINAVDDDIIPPAGFHQAATA